MTEMISGLFYTIVEYISLVEMVRFIGDKSVMCSYPGEPYVAAAYWPCTCLLYRNRAFSLK